MHISKRISLTGIGKAMDDIEEKEKLVGSLMFLKNGHFRMSTGEGIKSSFAPLKKHSIWKNSLHKEEKE